MKRHRRISAAYLVVAMGAAVALVSEVGHRVLGRLGDEAVHHFFHAIFGGGAVVLFAIYLGVHITRHGRPSFSRRIRP